MHRRSTGKDGSCSIDALERVEEQALETLETWRRKEPMNTKRINISLMALAGQSSQARTPTHARDKRDKMPISLWNLAETASLSQGRVPFVPGRFLFFLNTVPPKMFMFIGFLLTERTCGTFQHGCPERTAQSCAAQDLMLFIL